MKQKHSLAYVVGLWFFAGCGASSPTEAADIGQIEQALAGSEAKGVLPAGLPARVSVGLFEGSGSTWMKSSGVPWDMRYQYFTKGWVNNWGWGAADGSWGRNYLNESSTQGFIPVVQYYQMQDEPGGGEAQFLAKVQNAATMKSYFSDFKILLQQAKGFGKPVVVLMEADGYGLLEQQSNNNPNAYAAIKDTGLAELSNLPNSVAGWGLAFLALRNSVGANNVRLGIHISGWASGKDIAYHSVTDPLQPEVDKVYNFLAPLGLASNVTGSTYDLLVGDPLDRDSDYYRLVRGENRWWDTSDTAPIASKSFNRYAEWLRLWNVKTSRRWVLWQIPLGNSNHKNVANNGGSAEGYKDNRAEYFFNGNTEHIAKFANSGVVALLFGAGASGMSTYTNDTYGDGQLFLKSRAGAFLNAGGLPIATGSGGGSGGSGGSVGQGGATGSGGSTSTGPSVRYDFESNVQGWQSSGGNITGVSSSTTRAASGARSLAVQFNGAAGVQTVSVANASVPAGARVSFKIWLPAGSAISAVQPYALQGAAGSWAWTGSWQATSSLQTNAWNTLSVTLPSNASTPLHQLGVQFTTSATWQGTAFVDSVSW